MTSINYRGYEIASDGEAWTGRKGDNFAQAPTLDELKELIDCGETVMGAWALARPKEKTQIMARSVAQTLEWGKPSKTVSPEEYERLAEAWRNRPHADENLYDAPALADPERVYPVVGLLLAGVTFGAAAYLVAAMVRWVLGW